MEKTYVTFGQVHTHRVGNVTLDCDCVAVISCANKRDGREKAFELFGDKFFTTYHEEAFDQGKLRFFPTGLIELKV